MRSAWIVVCVAALLCLGSAFATFENVKVERAISLTGNVVRHYVEIEAVNTGSQSEATYSFVVSSALASKLAFVSVTDKDGSALSFSEESVGASRSVFFSPDSYSLSRRV
jgi:hypothetical protein